MARIVLGLGSSHTPQISTDTDTWDDHANRDMANSELLGLDGQYHSFDELLAQADPDIGRQLDAAVWDDKYERCQRAVAELAARLAAVNPDVVVVVGDDQEELFGPDGNPAFSVFLGENLEDRPPSDGHVAGLAIGLQKALWAAHAPEPDMYPCAPELTLHLVRGLVADGFDMHVFSEQPAGRSLGHAFTFVRRRLNLPRETPIVPIFVNTYFEPNVPLPGRCYEFGRALRRALESWPDNTRVAILASGGLSHFVVNEKLDREVLSALSRSDFEAISAIDPRHLRSGTSEILNWVVAGAALEHLSMKVIDYVAGYRSLAGTGTAMCFSVWT
jgi:3-O-methylgallate 3,4-dioxygenase